MFKRFYHTPIFERLITSHHTSLLRTTLKVGALGFLIYSLFVYFMFSNELLASINAVAFIIYAFSCLDFRINENYIRTTDNKDTTLFGTLLFPIFVFSLNGRVLGTLYTVVFFAVIYTLAYQGIAIWNEGTFSQLAYAHYIAATILLTLFVYILQTAFESYVVEHNEQNQQLKEAQRLASIGSWEWDIINNQAKWSDETFNILGMDPKKDKADFANSRALTHPDDLHLLDETVAQAIEHKKDYDITRRIVLRNGQEKIVHGKAKIFYDELGNPLRMVGTMQDITEQKRIKNALREQKEAFETIFKKSHDGVLIIKDGIFIDCNDAALRMLKASSKEHLLQTYPGELSPSVQPNGEDSSAKARDMMQKALDEGIVSFECCHKAFDGSLFMVDVVLTRLEINNKMVIHASWRDITTRKRLEKELRDSHFNLEEKVKEKTKELSLQKERAEAASKAKSEFLTNMNHELRTPLNAILGFIYLLSEEENNPHKKRQFDLVKQGSESLLNIINDVLDFSKIESGKFTLNCANSEINESSKSFLEFLGGAAAKKSIGYHIDVETAIPPLYTDHLRLEQVMANLIGNAIKFTPKNGTIFVKLFYDITKNQLCFSVKDNGIGISKADQELILQPFSQADMSTTRAYGGTGLGLTISQELLTMMGGELHIKSKEGEGSEFSFHIPYQETSYSLTQSLPVTRKDIKLSTEGSILVAEDNEMNLALYEELFKKLEIQNVTFVEDGYQAFEAYKREKHPLLLLDIDMPIMDGKEVYSHIRAYEEEHALEQSKILAITASSDEENKKSLMKLGFDDFLAKPVNFNNFKRTLQHHLQSLEVTTS
jgi:PAS domain S-box-containing protein